MNHFLKSPTLTLLVLTCLIIWNPSSVAQNLDSLASIVELQKGRDKAKTLILLAEVTYNEEDLLKAYYYTKTENFITEYQIASLNLAEYLAFEQNKLDDAKRVIEGTIESSSSTKLSPNKIGLYLSLSVIYNIERQYLLAIKHGLMAIDLSESLNSNKLLLESHLTTSEAYSQFSGNQERSKFHLLKALYYINKDTDQESIYNIYNNLGAFYALNHGADSALYYYSIAAEHGRQYLHEENRALILSNIAFIHVEQDSLERAQIMLDSANQLNVEYKDTLGLTFDHYLYSKLFLKKNNLLKAEFHALESKKLADIQGMQFELINSYECLKNVYSALGEHKKHAFYLSHFYALKDSLNIQEREVFNQNFEARLQAEKKDAQIKQLHDTSEWQKLFQYYLIAGIIGLIFIGYLFFNRFRLKQNAQKAKLKQYRAERTTHRLQLESAQAQRKAKQYEVLQKERELTAKMTFSVKRSELLDDIGERLSSIYSKSEGRSREEVFQLQKILEKQSRLSEDWSDLILHFEHVHPTFFKHLEEKGISLTPNEERLCVYAYMRLDTRTVSRLMSISTESVNKARYRLRKKLSIEKAHKLEDFISELIKPL